MANLPGHLREWVGCSDVPFKPAIPTEASSGEMDISTNYYSYRPAWVRQIAKQMVMMADRGSCRDHRVTRRMGIGRRLDIKPSAERRATSGVDAKLRLSPGDY